MTALLKYFVICCLLMPTAALAQRNESRTLTWQGIERTYVVHFPADNLIAPAPLVVALAGLTQDLDSLRRWLPIDPVADQNRFIVVYPQAIDLKWNYWHGSGQLVPGGTEEIDDIGFIATVVASLVKGRLADPARVFVTGISRGALMSWTLACERADMFAAAAPISSAMTAWQLAHCHPARPMTVVAVDGTEDPVQLYDGFIYSPPIPRLISVPETLAFWWQLNGCTQETGRALPHQPHDLTQINIFEWSSCSSGNGVKFYRVNRGGHAPPTLAVDEPPGPQRFGLLSHQMETADVIWHDFAAIKSRTAP